MPEPRTLRSLVKGALRAVSPSAHQSISAALADRHGRRVMEACGVPEIAAAFVERYGLVVQAGPFEGMRYVDGAAGSSFVPKLIGSYEAELHPILERVLASRYDVVVDIGAAEGYYAVGLALRLPSPLRVYAFDSNRRARGLLKEMARVNGVEDLVVVGGTCSTAVLELCLHTGGARPRRERL